MRTRLRIAPAFTVGAAALIFVVGAAGQALAATHTPIKASTTASASTVPISKHFHLNTTLSGVTFRGESQLTNGDFVAIWKTRSETVKVAAPAGTTVTLVTPTSKSAGVAVTLPTRGLKPAQMTAGRLRPASSVVPNAVAIGFTPAQVQALIPAHSGIQPQYSVGNIIATPCVSVSGDSGYAWGRACDTQKFLQDNGGGNWIVGDQVVGSGNDPGFNTANLTALTAWVSYGANNNIFNWSPNATVTTGGCGNYTASLGYNSTGVSASTTLCSDSLNPYDANSGTSFGSSWSGCDNNAYTEGLASADIDNNPWNASDAVTLHLSISWNYWCI